MIHWSGNRARADVLARAWRVVDHACKHMAGRARLHVPKDTWAMHDSIEVIPGSMVFILFVGVPYADPVHNGHIAGTTWVPPNPFLLRAIEDTRVQWPQLVVGAITSSFTT